MNVITIDRKMSLTKFTLPGKDCRCILYDGKVCKIKTLMPPLKDGTISEYIDDKSLQEELEDIFRAVLCIPQNVEPVIMRTEHLFVKPERKEWKLPNKMEFKKAGQSLNALSYMFVLNVQLHADKPETRDEAQIQETVRATEENTESKKRKTEGSFSSPSKTSEQSKRAKRRLIQEGSKSSSSSPRRSNRRMAPSRSSVSSSSKSGYVLRKRALRITSTNRNNNRKMQREDDIDLDENRMIDGRDGWTDRRNRETIEIDRQDRERSPELESGFSRLVQGKAPVSPERFPRVNEALDKEHSHVECTADQGPMPAWPSDGATARVVVPGHPGRERVEQHVLQEQLRLQQMASPSGDATANEQPDDRGVVHRVYDAIVTPVKKFLSRD